MKIPDGDLDLLPDLSELLGMAGLLEDLAGEPPHDGEDPLHEPITEPFVEEDEHHGSHHPDQAQ